MGLVTLQGTTIAKKCFLFNNCFPFCLTASVLIFIFFVINYDSKLCEIKIDEIQYIIFPKKKKNQTKKQNSPQCMSEKDVQCV